MALPKSLCDREQDKFRETDTGRTCVAVCGDNGPIDVGVVAGTPNILNISLPVANTEVSQTLTTNVKRLEIRARQSNARLQFAFTITESGTKFITIPAGTTFSIDALDLVAATLYIQSDKTSTVVEVLEFI